MAYVYSNALNVSLALIVFGAIQVSMWVSCLFGCFASFPLDFAAPAWSGGLAICTGFFGVGMICSYKEFQLGVVFFIMSIISMVASLACIVLTAGYTILLEYALADKDAREGYEPGSRGPFLVTGLAIDGSVIIFGLALLICTCYASWLNCCCEKRSHKGYVMSLETVQIENAYQVQAEPHPL